MNQVSQYREKIMQFEHALKQMPQFQEELHHHFAAGIYAREMRVPCGTILVGKIHRFPCINFIMQGIVEVRSEQGAFRVEAPHIFVSPEGTKRAMVAITDLIWVTAHPANTTDLDQLERELICEDWPRLMCEEDICPG